MVLGWGSKKAQVQHEEEDMSMEEILASIRKYVSEETTAKETTERPIEQPLAKAESSYRQEGMGSSRRSTPSNEGYEDSVFVPRNTFEDSSLFNATSQEDLPEDYPITRETLKPRPQQGAHFDKKPDMPTQNPFARLAEATKKEAQTSTSASSTRTNLTLDQLIGELARPMIQRWLDQNLPKIVEQMVAEEIAKMTGGR